MMTDSREASLQLPTVKEREGWRKERKEKEMEKECRGCDRWAGEPVTAAIVCSTPGRDRVVVVVTGF